MRRLAIVCAALMLAACNLSDQQPRTPTTEPEDVATEIDAPTDAPDENRPTALPGVMTPNPNSNALPSRTPVGNQLQATPTQFNSEGVAPTNAVPTSETGESAVVNSPANGSTISTGNLIVSGVVSGLAQDQFTIAIIAPNEQPVNTQLIYLNNPNHVNEVPWSAALQVTRYTGPAEIQLIAKNAAGEDILLASVNVNITQGGSGAAGGNSTTRTESAIARITTPSDGGAVSGDSIQVSGTAGGIAGNAFTVELVAPDGTVLTSQAVTYTSTAVNVVVPWAVALGTSGYTGQATIRASIQGATLDTTQVQVQ